MRISGLQKMTLLDYPGKIACTVFLGGCNFRCPFCHNGELLDGSGEPVMDEQEFLGFLSKRKGLLDAVCISGGEPTLQAGLADLLEKIKKMGYLTKLDTNGSRPEVLKALVERGLLDYVAMDIKNSPERYAQTAGAAVQPEKIEESIRYLLEDHVDYELRTTVVAQLHDVESVVKMENGSQPVRTEKKQSAGSCSLLWTGIRCFLQVFPDRMRSNCRNLPSVWVLFPYIPPSVDDITQYIVVQEINGTQYIDLYQKMRYNTGTVRIRYGFVCACIFSLEGGKCYVSCTKA